MEARETKEKIAEAAESVEPRGHNVASRRVGLLIAGFAALLAITEAAGKGAQTEALNANIQASDLWAFFQAKTIRSTTLKTAVEAETLKLGSASAEERVAAQNQIDAWNATIARYESDPSTGEGRKELTDRATQAEHQRDQSLSSYHLFEYGSAAFQLAIVLASAALVSGLSALMWVAIGLGGVGLLVDLLGWLAPAVFHV